MAENKKEMEKARKAVEQRDKADKSEGYRTIDEVIRAQVEAAGKDLSDEEKREIARIRYQMMTNGGYSD